MALGVILLQTYLLFFCNLNTGKVKVKSWLTEFL